MTAQQLKNSILQLAVQGKLVPQDKNDESAITLVNRIRREQERLLKEKIIKKEKFNSSIDYDEQLPNGWCYVKIGELTSLVTKQTGFDYSKTIKPNLSESKLDGMIPMVQTKNFKGKDFSLDTDYYIPLSIAKDFPKILLDSKCMLLSIVGASIGNIGIYNHEDLAMIGGAICKVKLLEEELYDYLYYYFQSPLGQQEIRKNMKATAQGTITVQDVREIVVKMPPLSEQKRIVAKIEELLPYIEKYDKAESKLTELNTKFPDALKKSILQEAVQGKLVPQNPDDEPASVLLEHIRAEKQKLIKEGKIKKDKPLAPITEDEIPFDIPESWEWIRLSDVGEVSRGRSQHRPRNDHILFDDGEYPLIQTGDVARSNGVINSCSSYYNEKGLAQSRMWAKGTLCLTIAANIGDVGILGFDACFPDSVVGFNAYKPIVSNDYFLYMLMAYKEILDRKSTKTAQKNINLERIASLAYPLPPVEEQKRIVAKIEELMPFINAITK